MILGKSLDTSIGVIIFTILQWRKIHVPTKTEKVNIRVYPRVTSKDLRRTTHHYSNETPDYLTRKHVRTRNFETSLKIMSFMCDYIRCIYFLETTGVIKNFRIT